MKKSTNRLTSALTAFLLLVCAGCGNGNNQTTTAASSAPQTEDTEATVTEATGDSTVKDTEEPAEDIETGEDDILENSDYDTPEKVKVAALKGPTAMGMIKLMDDSKNDPESIYDFEIYAAPDELSPLIIKGDVDIACVPANLAATLYNKTEGKVEVLAVNTLGVLYIVENGGETIKSVEDLKGKTIYASGQGSTPEYALNYILAQNGIADEVNIEWKAEHAECVTALLNNEGSAALLPQPFVTTAIIKNTDADIKVALDLTKEWDKLNNGSSLITGVVVGRKEFIESYSGALSEFLDGYRDSVTYVLTDNDGAAALIGKYDIVPEAVAKKALPACNITFISGDEMKTRLSGYLSVLADSDPKSVGGKLPDEAFYYVG